MPRRYAPHELVETFSRLSSLPEVYLRIKQAVDSPDAGLDEMAKVISNDPGITARLLRAVNSPMYGVSRRIESVARALSILGMQQVHDIILAGAVTTAFAGMPANLMDVRRFWTASLRRALAARYLGKTAGLVDSERLFVVGLLSRIGHMVMYDKIPQLASVALSHAQRTGTALYAVERQIIGCDYAAVGSELLARWKLPTPIVEMIADHLEPEHAQSFAIGAAVLHLAAAIAEIEPGANRRLTAETIGEYLWEATGLTPDAMSEAERQVNDEFAAAAEVFMPSLRAAA